MKWLQKWFGFAPAAPAVTASFRKEAGGIYVLRVGGTLNKATLDNIQSVARHNVAAGVQDIKALLFLEDFRGWKRGDDWGDLDFFSRYEASIAKIAVVGDPRWESETLLFLGAGRRHGEVRFFTPHFEDRARAWLAE